MTRLEEIAREKEKLKEDISKIDAEVERILNLKEVVLSGEDLRWYEKIRKKGRLDTPQKFLAFKTSLNAPRYALRELEQEECGIGGHSGEKVLGYENEFRAWCHCGNCGEMYDRPINSKEYKKLREINSRPFTI